MRCLNYLESSAAAGGVSGLSAPPGITGAGGMLALGLTGYATGRIFGPAGAMLGCVLGALIGIGLGVAHHMNERF